MKKIAFLLLFLGACQLEAQLMKVRDDFYVYQDATHSIKVSRPDNVEGQLKYFSEQFMVMTFTEPYMHPYGYVFLNGKLLSSLTFSYPKCGYSCDHADEKPFIKTTSTTAFLACSYGLQNGIAMHEFDLTTGERKDIPFPDNILNQLPIPEDNYYRDATHNTATNNGWRNPKKLFYIVMPDSNTILYHCDFTWDDDKKEKSANYPLILYNMTTRNFETIQSDAIGPNVIKDNQEAFYIFYDEITKGRSLSYFDFKTKKTGWLGVIKDYGVLHLYADNNAPGKYYLENDEEKVYGIQNGMMEKISSKEFDFASKRDTKPNRGDNNVFNINFEYDLDPYDTRTTTSARPILHTVGGTYKLDFLVDAIAENGKCVVVFADTASRSQFYFDRMARENGGMTSTELAKIAKIESHIVDVQEKLYKVVDSLNAGVIAFQKCIDNNTDCTQQVMNLSFLMQSLDKAVDSYLFILDKYRDQFPGDYYATQRNAVLELEQKWKNHGAIKTASQY